MTSGCAGTDDALVRRVRAEYREMPGLRLTVLQAQRLLAIDAPTTEALLDLLAQDGFLSQTRDGAYVMCESY